MLTRTKETVEEFDPKEYDIKHMRFLNEIYAGETTILPLCHSASLICFVGRLYQWL
jgi:hypothetical protein